MKEFTIKEQLEKLEQKCLKRYLKYYGLESFEEMSNEQLDELESYFKAQKQRFLMSVMKDLANGKIAIIKEN